jgi:hypothetical protein
VRLCSSPLYSWVCKPMQQAPQLHVLRMFFCHISSGRAAPRGCATVASAVAAKAVPSAAVHSARSRVETPA